MSEARPEDAPAMAAIHLTARQQAMPYLHSPHTDEETREFFARVMGDKPAAWWTARREGEVVAYMLINEEDLDHLYVAPARQGQGLGSALLNKAKALSPARLVLWTFQRNARARAFYEAHGFRCIRQTNGANEEQEPDVQYEWQRVP